MSAKHENAFKSKNLTVKQNIQNLVFPEGLRFNKEKNDYRTCVVNPFFSAISYLSDSIAQKESGTFDLFDENSAVVARTRIELVFPP